MGLETILRGYVCKILMVGFALIAITVIFYPLPPLQEQSILWAICLVVIFLHRKNPKPIYLVLDLALCCATIAVFGYVAISHVEIQTLMPGSKPPFIEFVFGIILLVLCLEATRRRTGWMIVFIAVFFLAYAFVGQYLPRVWGGHDPIPIKRIIEYLYLSENAVFGALAHILFKYIFLFLLFGKILEACGALSYVKDLSLVLLGRFRGGPALVSVISSGLVGSITGSAVANVMITGSFTIPLMKSLGFKPEEAAAIEASASTGGQILPPVMAGTAFMIMLFLPVSYMDIVKAAIIPGVLYFIGILAAVYFIARRRSLGRLSEEQLPKPRQLFRIDALTFFGSILILVIYLLRGYSPATSALYGGGAALIFSQLSKNRIGLRQFVKCFEQSTGDFLLVGGACASLALLIGSIYVTGLGVRVSSLITEFCGNSLPLLLLMGMFAAFILGMGMPTTAAYLMCAIIIAPVLIRMHILPMAAHMFIFYAGLFSMITPPVALSAYAAAGIAKSNIVRTGLSAMIISIPVFVLPFAFVYNNALLMVGNSFEVLNSAVFAVIALTFLSFVFFGDSGIPERAVITNLLRLFMSAFSFLMLWPDINIRFIGLVGAVFIYWMKAIMQRMLAQSKQVLNERL